MTLKYVKKIKGTANKNGLKNAMCKQGFNRLIMWYLPARLLLNSVNPGSLPLAFHKESFTFVERRTSQRFFINGF